MRLASDLGALDLAARRCHNALIACVSVDTKEDTHSDAAPRKPAWMLGLQAFGSILSLSASQSLLHPYPFRPVSCRTPAGARKMCQPEPAATK
jgi:hypothetical protein